MASRTRTAIPTLGNRENGLTPRSKALGVLTKERSALGEIGNKVNGTRGANHLILKPAPKPFEKTQQVLVKKTNEKIEPPLSPRVRHRIEEPQQQQQLQQQQAQPEEAGNVSFSSDLLVEDIDQDDVGNPILVSLYSNDIYEHLRDLERKSQISPGFLNGQRVTPKMRSVLIDWLVEVHQQFHLTQETLYLTVATIDRFLQSDRSIDRKRLQLVGITSMFVASKYEEMYSPDINDFVYITDNAYTKAEVLQMEMRILKVLDFSLGRPLPLQFLRRYSKAGKAMAIHHTMAKYFLEESLIRSEMCHYAPSLIAAAALYLSFFVIGTEETDPGDEKRLWTPTLAHYSTYKDEELLPVVQKIAAFILTADQSRHQAVRKKFMQSKNMKISLRAELKSPTMAKLAATQTRA